MASQEKTVGQFLRKLFHGGRGREVAKEGKRNSSGVLENVWGQRQRGKNKQVKFVGKTEESSRLARESDIWDKKTGKEGEVNSAGYLGKEGGVQGAYRGWWLGRHGSPETAAYQRRESTTSSCG